MYMLSAHQQIEPARPSITRRQAGKQGRRASRGQGAWSFVKRARFKIAARVGRDQRNGAQVQAGTGWIWMALAGDWMAPAGCRWCS